MDIIGYGLTTFTKHKISFFAHTFTPFVFEWEAKWKWNDQYNIPFLKTNLTFYSFQLSSFCVKYLNGQCGLNQTVRIFHTCLLNTKVKVWKKGKKRQRWMWSIYCTITHFATDTQGILLWLSCMQNSLCVLSSLYIHSSNNKIWLWRKNSCACIYGWA